MVTFNSITNELLSIFICSCFPVVAIFNSPMMVHLFSFSSHKDSDFAAWHELFLWNCKVLVGGLEVLVWSVGPESFNISGDAVVLRVEPPSLLITSLSSTDEAIGQKDISGGSGEWMKVTLGINTPLLSEVCVLSMVNNSSSILDSEDHIVLGILRLLEMKPHAFAWLHGGGHWLSDVLGECWSTVAVDNFNLKVHVSVKRDWLATERCLSVGSTPSIERWAVESGLCS